MHWVGNGFPVRSVFDYHGLGRELSPFLLLDYVAPYEFAPGDEKRGVGAHPLKSFETVTVAYQGELEHRDSGGGGGKICAGGSVRESRDSAPMRIAFTHIPDAGWRGIEGLTNLTSHCRSCDIPVWPRNKHRSLCGLASRLTIVH